MIRFLGLILFVSLGFNCSSQDGNQASGKPFDFTGITFYSSACNGTCPDITMSINSSKKIQLIRIVYKPKGVVDRSKSSGFKGVLGQNDYDKLIALIKEIDWEHLKWEEQLCCDLPVITLLLSVDEKRKEIRTMKWPQELNKLITFLTDLGSSVKLPKYSGTMDFEGISDL